MKIKVFMVPVKSSEKTKVVDKKRLVVKNWLKITDW
jgi:hypothetical protein